MYAPAVAGGGYGGDMSSEAGARRRWTGRGDLCHVRCRDPEAAPPSRPGCPPAYRICSPPLSQPQSDHIKQGAKIFFLFFSPVFAVTASALPCPAAKWSLKLSRLHGPSCSPLVSRFPFGSGDPLKRCRFEAPRLEWTIVDKSESDLVGEKR